MSFSLQKSRCRLSKLSLLTPLLLIVSGELQQPTLANNKVDAILHSKESMQLHCSDEPRRLMHEVILATFAKGGVIAIVNPENSPQPVKYRSANYHIGANLIAFSFAPKTPTHVSLSLQLMKDSNGQVLLTSDRVLEVEQRAIEEALKMSGSDFNKSEYGKALTTLSRLSANTFEEKVKGLNLSTTASNAPFREETHTKNAKGRCILHRPSEVFQ
jgi:hypothetical protein